MSTPQEKPASQVEAEKTTAAVAKSKELDSDYLKPAATVCEKGFCSNVSLSELNKEESQDPRALVDKILSTPMHDKEWNKQTRKYDETVEKDSVDFKKAVESLTPLNDADKVLLAGLINENDPHKSRRDVQAGEALLRFANTIGSERYANNPRELANDVMVFDRSITYLYLAPAVDCLATLARNGVTLTNVPKNESMDLVIQFLSYDNSATALINVKGDYRQIHQSPLTRNPTFGKEVPNN